MKDQSNVKLNNKISQERDLRVWWRCALGAVVGVQVAFGFAVAAQHHFNALEQSARNVQLQHERQRLKSEQKRLLHERESAASPSQLEKMARDIGLQNVNVRQINNFAQADAAAPPVEEAATAKNAFPLPQTKKKNEKKKKK